jgi:hypothetical protein
VHGDYLTGAIRNTPNELAKLDPDISAEFREIVRRYGLIVLGYSGADLGVMEILRDATFRAGLYWVTRGSGAAPAEVEERASVITADDGPSFVRDLLRRVDALATQPSGRLPEAEYREVTAMLRDADYAAVERRARQLGRRLREQTIAMRAEAAAHPERIPGAVTDDSKLASWEPLLTHTFRPVEPALRSFLAAATAAIEQRSPAVALFATELVPLFESVSFGGSSWVSGIPQLVVSAALSAMLGRSASLGRWEQLSAIASIRGRGTYGRGSDLIALSGEVLHPVALGDHADVAVDLAADLLRRDPLNAELAIEDDAAASSVREANTLLGVVDRAGRASDLRPYFRGFVRLQGSPFLARLAADSTSLDGLARLAGEDPAVFRSQFSQRFLDELNRHNGGMWPPYDARGFADELAAISEGKATT